MSNEILADHLFGPVPCRWSRPVSNEILVDHLFGPVALGLCPVSLHPMKSLLIIFSNSCFPRSASDEILADHLFGPQSCYSGSMSGKLCPMKSLIDHHFELPLP